MRGVGLRRRCPAIPRDKWCMKLQRHWPRKPNPERLLRNYLVLPFGAAAIPLMVFLWSTSEQGSRSRTAPMDWSHSHSQPYLQNKETQRKWLRAVTLYREISEGAIQRKGREESQQYDRATGVNTFFSGPSSLEWASTRKHRCRNSSWSLHEDGSARSVSVEETARSRHAEAQALLLVWLSLPGVGLGIWTRSRARFTNFIWPGVNSARCCRRATRTEFL